MLIPEFLNFPQRYVYHLTNNCLLLSIVVTSLVEFPYTPTVSYTFPPQQVPWIHKEGKDLVGDLQKGPCVSEYLLLRVSTDMFPVHSLISLFLIELMCVYQLLVESQCLWEEEPWLETWVSCEWQLRNGSRPCCQCPSCREVLLGGGQCALRCLEWGTRLLLVFLLPFLA